MYILFDKTCISYMKKKLKFLSNSAIMIINFSINYLFLYCSMQIEILEIYEID